MNRTSIRRAIVPGIAALTLALSSACSAGNADSGNASGSDSGSGSLSGTLNGGGSSAQESAQEAWRAGFQGANSGVTVNYDPVGSGTGAANFISGAYAFAGSDAALTTEGGQLDQAKQRCGGDVIEVPAYISPIAVIFNLSGVSSLNLDGKTIAEIFAGKITKWNDPAIAKANPGVNLPDETITPVHRSDDSGTTYNFTDYLSQAGGGAWTSPANETWPMKGGEAADGTSGVVAAVQAGQGTIGYADASQAGDLGQAAVKVGSSYNKPSAEGAAKVVAESPLEKGRGATDMVVDVDRTSTSAGAYPLMLVSYEIACPTYSDASQAALVKGYLSYLVSKQGQEAAAKQAGPAPLAPSMEQKAEAIVEKIAAK